MNSHSWSDFEDIFNINLNQRRDEAPEYLAVVVELTINLPSNSKDLKQLNLLQKTNILKEIFQNFKEEYKATSGSHEIEYCKTGEPHLHGFLETQLHPNVYSYETSELLRMFAKSIFLKLPKSIYKQFAKADINEYLKRFKSPAVCLNLKNILSHGWTDYMQKNAP